jgi:hypothetical protein
MAIGESLSHVDIAVRTPRDRFVDDSALEGDGFDLPVPRA